MSALYVRQKFREWFATVPTLVYYDTVNAEVKPTDLIWFSAEFLAEDISGLITCDGYTEFGVVDTVFHAQPGIGDVALLTALEPAVAHMMTFKDVDPRLQITDHEPVREASSGSADRTYRLAVGIRYSYAT